MCAWCFCCASQCARGASVVPGASCGIRGCWCNRRAAVRRGLCCAHTPLCAVPGGLLAGFSPASCCFLVHVFACFVCARFVLLPLLLHCSVFWVPAVCCCASSCPTAGDDSLRSCHTCFSKCILVDVNNTHTWSEKPPQPSKPNILQSKTIRVQTQAPQSPPRYSSRPQFSSITRCMRLPGGRHTATTHCNQWRPGNKEG